MSTGRRLDLKVGWSCNNRCAFCVQGDKRDRFADRESDALIAELEASRPGCDGVVLTGGEPTVRRDLPDLVAAARDLGYRTIQLQTNGRALCHRPLLERLVGAGLTEVAPALHGPDPAVHDALVRAPGAFKQTVRGIRHARALGLPVVLNSVVVRRNVQHLPAMARLFVALDVASFQLAFVHALGTAGQHIDDVMPRLSDARPFLHAALAVGRAASVSCWTEGVPLCFLGPLAAHASERRIPSTRIVDADRVVEDYTLARREQAKAKGPPCAECSDDAVCEGPWREYPERFGWGEMTPRISA